MPLNKIPYMNRTMNRNRIVIAVTKKGTELALNLAERFQADLKAPLRFLQEEQRNFGFTMPISELLSRAFDDYPVLVLIMSVGYAVRNLAPFLRMKHANPAVIVIDDDGRFVVSLLPGERNAASQLVEEMAVLTRGIPVVTTSPTLDQFPALDELARENHLIIDSPQLLLKFTSAITNGDEIVVWDRLELRRTWPDNIRVESGRFPKLAPEEKLLLNIGFEDPPIPAPGINVLALRPVCLVVGVDCALGLPGMRVIGSIRRYFREHYLSIKSIKNIVIMESKAKERGLIEASREFRVEMLEFSKRDLETININQSEIIPGRSVLCECELAAILGANQGQLIGARMDYGQIAIAVAVNLEELK